MNVQKNIQFSRHIKTAGSLKEFNFRNQRGIPESVYLIDVSDERGNRHSFSMQLIDGSWNIREKSVADWIRAAVPELHAAIEHLEALI